MNKSPGFTLNSQASNNSRIMWIHHGPKHPMNDPARLPRVASSDQFCFGQFRLDISKRRLTQEHAEVRITRSEYLLLRTLAMHRGETVSRRQLMQAIWGTATTSHGALDTLVSALRRKLIGLPSGLLCDAGINGYTLKAEAQPSEPKQNGKAKQSAPAS